MQTVKSEKLTPFSSNLADITASWSDGKLLEHFIQEKDASAFEALVLRYGPMVYGVCLRALEDDTDAEDAFQATFLVLARKASSIRQLNSVRPWLYGVAQRIAQKMRLNGSRRRQCEKRAAELRPALHIDDLTVGELRSILDEEIARLPETYRIPLILCCLEGKSRDEAAQELGWSTGAVKGRLERGREELRARLTRRGLKLTAVFFILTLLQKPAAAAVPASLVAATVGAGVKMAGNQTLAGVVSAQALSFTHSYLHSVLLTKLKLVVMGLLMAAVVSAGVVAYQPEPETVVPASEVPAEQQGAPPRAPKPQTPKPAASKSADKKAFKPTLPPLKGPNSAPKMV